MGTGVPEPSEGAATATLGAYRCAPCDRYWQASELDRTAPREGIPAFDICPICRRPVTFEAHSVARPYREALVSALRFPLHAESAVYWLGVAAVGALLAYAGGLGWVFAASILLGYVFTVIRTSARGAETVPIADDFLEVFDLIRPLVQMALSLAAITFPAWMLVAFVDGAAAKFALVFFGLIAAPFTPLALIVAAHSRTVLGAFNPVAIARVYGRLPGAYAATCLALVGALALGTLSFFVAAAVAWVLAKVLTILAYLILGVHVTYVSVVCGRVLGLFLYEHRYELGQVQA